ncbi:MAG: glycosyltransferase [Bacteroidota bacterium]|nr:glycosyltransferase [Bacteroidota bacterium]
MDVSIIIPCFNSGEFLPEAIKSAELASKGFNTELIIVDDGSTDQYSLNQLTRIEAQYNHVVLHRFNGGPAAARNTGVQVSSGKYLLFLDSDNKLRPEFLSSTLPALESNPKAGVVYGNAAFFGELPGRKSFVSRAFDKYELLVDNYIDVCSLVRRETFEQAGGFDENRLIIGYEDWEFWIRVSATSWNFVYMPKILFDYRLRKSSVITDASTDENYKNVLSYVCGKNAAVFHERFTELYHEKLFYLHDKQKPFRSYVKFLKEKYISGSKNQIR